MIGLAPIYRLSTVKKMQLIPAMIPAIATKNTNTHTNTYAELIGTARGTMVTTRAAHTMIAVRRHGSFTPNQFVRIAI